MYIYKMIFSITIYISILSNYGVNNALKLDTLLDRWYNKVIRGTKVKATRKLIDVRNGRIKGEVLTLITVKNSSRGIYLHDMYN